MIFFLEMSTGHLGDTNMKHSLAFPTLLSSHGTIGNHQMPDVLTCKPREKPAPYKPCIHQQTSKKDGLHDVSRRKHAKTSPGMTR